MKHQKFGCITYETKGPINSPMKSSISNIKSSRQSIKTEKTNTAT